MKHKNSLLIVVMLLFVACTNHDMEEIIVPTEGYIYFNTEVSSRGTLVVNDLQGKDFAVTGYKYTGDWNTVKVQAKPDGLLYNLPIRWNSTSNSHTYDAYPNDGNNALVAWEAEKNYTFFAHYPYVANTNATNDLIEVSGASNEGVPYIVYNMPTGNDVSKLVDVMTASHYDTNNAYSNAVGLTFKHRLVAMDVQARNFNEPDEETGKPLNILITSLTMKLNNLAYNQATLMMDASLPNASTFTKTISGTWQPQYTLITEVPIMVAPTGTQSGDGEPTNLTGTKDYPKTTLIFMPQNGVKNQEGVTEYLKGTITFSYQYVDNEGNVLKVIDGKSVGDKDGIILVENMAFTTGKNMVAGRRYCFQMTFSRSTITIAVVESGEWTDKNVNIEFE